ncbi:MATE family efflux transporter [uncultured Cohaesibacter sp.]|uniref:MATE family efflux transporter n=1 Tax=uncultured Cohaesibacter sp. TaxID=1002546 RepID=UPI0029311EC4|nr:MATE family efflux transporter [uncultured Cohaesibacter sp.]
METAPAAVNVRAFTVTHRMVLGIAIPMTLGLLTVPVVGIVDMAVIGQLGQAALIGGIAIGSTLFDLVAASCNFLRMGTTGLTAQAIGAGDKVSERAVAYRALMLALMIGFLTILIGPMVLPWALTAMGGSQEVNEAARSYLLIRLYAMPFSLSNFAIFGWLFGLSKSRQGMVLLFLQNSVNIILTVWFVMGLGLGVTGAALGSVTAEAVTVLAGLGMMAHHLRDDWRVPTMRLFAREAFLRFLAVNSDIFIRSMVMLFTFTLFTSLSARQGDDILAANELLMKFFMFGGFFLDGIATAAEQLGGRAIGAQYRPAFDRTVRLTLVWGVGLGLFLSLLMIGFGSSIINALTTAEGVRELSGHFLIWAALTPLIGTFAFQMDGIYVGATWSSTMRNVSILSTSVFIILQYLAMPHLGNHGLWLSLMMFLATRGLSLALMLPRRRDAVFARG